MANETGNGHSPAQSDSSDHERVLAAIDEAYDLPGRFPVVLIAPSGSGFRDQLDVELGRLQGDAPFDIRERESRHGNYMSYRIELHVESAEDALAKKSALAELPGVLMTL
jgi:putative lipoic acid-binding regulatory protein